MANTISILIQAKDQASSTLEHVGDSIAGTGDKSAESSKKIGLMERSTAALAATTALAGVGMLGLKNVISDSIDAANRYTNAMTGLTSISQHFNVNAVQARQAAQKLAADGLMSVTEAAGGLKNLLASGFSLPEAINLMNRFKDSASFNRQAALGFGEAIVSATEGIKNGNSILVDNAGVTKNLSLMLTDAGFSAQDLMKATSDNNVRQAIYKGILKETGPMVGDAAKLADSFAGKQSLLATKTDLLQRTLGEKLQPILGLVIDKFMPLIEQVTIFIQKNPELTQQIAISAAAFVGLGTAIGGVLLAVQLIGGPVGLAIMAVSAAVAVAAGYVITHWSEVQNFFQTTAANIQNAWNRSVDFIKNGIAKVTDFVRGAFRTAMDIGRGVVENVSKALQASRDWFDKYKGAIQTVATILGVVFGPALLKAGVQAVVAGVKIAASGVSAGAGWVAGAVASSIAWTINTAKMIAVSAVVYTKMAADAIKSAAAWTVNAVVSSAAWLLNLGKIAVLSSVTAIRVALTAADAGYAWAINGARASFVWVVTELPKIVAAAAITAFQSTIHAATTSAAWVASAARSSFAWVVTELPKILASFIATSGQAVVQAAITSGAWISSAAQSAVAWVITELPKIIGAFIAMAGSAIVNAGIASGAWITAAAASSAAFTALSALVATPLVMPAIAVGAALASLALVYSKAQETLNVIDQTNAQIDRARRSGDATDIAMLKRSRDMSLPQSQRDAAVRYMEKVHVFGHALGTSHAPGGTTLVGEMGPEIVNMPKGAQVVPAYRTRAQGSTGGGTVLNVGVINNYTETDNKVFLTDIGLMLRAYS